MKNRKNQKSPVLKVIDVKDGFAVFEADWIHRNKYAAWFWDLYQLTVKGYEGRINDICRKHQVSNTWATVARRESFISKTGKTWHWRGLPPTWEDFLELKQYYEKLNRSYFLPEQSKTGQAKIFNELEQKNNKYHNAPPPLPPQPNKEPDYEFIGIISEMLKAGYSTQAIKRAIKTLVENSKNQTQ